MRERVKRQRVKEKIAKRSGKEEREQTIIYEEERELKKEKKR